MKLYKKIIIIMLVFLLAINIVQIRTTEAAAPKLVNQAVKQVVKEVVKQQVAEKTLRLIVNNEYKPSASDGFKKADNGYKIVCLDNYRKNNTCTKPMQAKTSLSKDDKTKIGNAVMKKIDSKTNHRGFKKLLDWILPVWLLSTGALLAKLLLDGDLIDFFVELTHDVFIDLGILKPVETGFNYIELDVDDYVTNPSDDDLDEYDNEIISNLDYYNMFLLDNLYSDVVPDLPFGVQVKDIYFNKRAPVYGSHVLSPAIIFEVFFQGNWYLSEGDKFHDISGKTLFLMVRVHKLPNFGETNLYTFRDYTAMDNYYHNHTPFFDEFVVFKSKVLQYNIGYFNQNETNALMHGLSNYLNPIISRSNVTHTLEPVEPVHLPRPKESEIEVPNPSDLVVRDNNGVVVSPQPKPNYNPEAPNVNDIEFVRPDGSVVPDTDLNLDPLPEYENLPEIEFENEPINEGEGEQPNDEPISDEIKGFWSKLWDYLQSILEAILSIPNKFISLLTSLFVPTIDLANEFNILRDSINDKFTSINDLKDILKGRENENSCAVKDININYMGVKAKIFDSSFLLNYANWYLPIIRGLLWFLFAWYVVRKIVSFWNKTGGVKL